MLGGSHLVWPGRGTLGELGRCHASGRRSADQRKIRLSTTLSVLPVGALGRWGLA